MQTYIWSMDLLRDVRNKKNSRQTAHMFPRKVPLLATSSHLEDGPTNRNWLENLVKKSLQLIIPYVGL